MADEINRIIFKAEFDDSEYTTGINSASLSTQKFIQQQELANKRLQDIKLTLKAATDEVIRQQQELDNANKGGTNIGVLKVRQDALKKAQTEQSRLTDLLKETEVEYEKVTKAAIDFANSTEKANTLAQGGRVPVPPIVPQPIVPIIPPNLTGLTGLDEAVGASAAEFEQLRGAIVAAELALSEMDQESEDFKTLTLAIKAGKEALAAYDAAAQSAGESTVSLRTQIRLGREELVKLEAQGQGNTKQYFELEKRVAKLTDAFGDQQQRIKILASDTKALDFGKGAITAATAAFSAYTSVSILVGNQSEELQKKTLQLFAAMQLLQSLEQLSNLTRREGVLATLAQSGAQSVYTAVIGASTGALKAFRIALAATGVGAVIAGIVFLVTKLNEFADAAAKAAEQQKLLKEINDEAIKSFSAQVTHLTLIKNSLNDLNIPQKERIALAKEYNKTAEEGNKIDLKQIDNIALVNQAIENQIKVIERRARAKAAENILTQRFETLFLAQEAARLKAGLSEITEKNIRTDLTKQPELKIGDIVPVFDPKSGKLKDVKLTQKDIDAFKKEAVKANVRVQNQLQAAAVQQAIENDPEVKAAQEAVNKALSLGLINIEDLIAPDIKGDVSTKKIENVFEAERAKLLARLAELRTKEAEGIESINKEFAAKLAVEKKRIEDIASDKITPTQRKILIGLAIDVNKAELDKALADFNKKVLDAREKLNDDLRKLQAKSTEDTLNLIKDEFEKRKKLIDFNEQQELADEKAFTDERLRSLDLDKLLIGEEAYQRAKDIIITTGEQNSLNILAKFAAQRKDLAADIFKQSLDAIGKGLNIGLIFRDENLATEVRDASNRFLQGKISYEKFQKELTDIQRREEAIRRDTLLNNQRSELAELDRHIASILDKTSQEFKDLTQRRNDLRAKIAAGEKEDAIKDAEEPATKNKERIDEVNKYVTAVGDLANSVIAFWQKANEVESAALDKSIALQEKRVEAAIRIAERGNAAYLKQEQDRLKELQVQKENAARKELAVNAALQASQILVAITGAVAKIADPITGPAEVIGSIAIIVSSLAAGYALVKSLQNNQPKFAKGDPYVRRNGHPSGVDTIPALLNEGEAVIPTETNRKYHPAIRAIYEENIPAEHINNFVKNYHSIKQVPSVNYQRIKESAELNITTDGRMAVAISEQNKLIQENNELQRKTINTLYKMGVQVNLDQHGFAVTQMEVIEQMKRDRKS